MVEQGDVRDTWPQQLVADEPGMRLEGLDVCESLQSSPVEGAVRRFFTADAFASASKDASLRGVHNR